jgi:hypothetical protein
MPSLCILDSSVFGLMPKIFAATCLPLTRPLVVFNDSIMRRFSTSSRVPAGSASDFTIWKAIKKEVISNLLILFMELVVIK